MAVCSSCGEDIPEGFRYCPKCGKNVEVDDASASSDGGGIILAPPDLLNSAPDTAPEPQAFQREAPILEAPESITDRAQGLDQVKGWNWGAFIFGFIWCFGNGLPQLGWIAIVLMFFPMMSFFVSVYLGVAGNEVLWKSRHFRSVAEFKEIQRKWTMGAFLVLFSGIALVLTAAVVVAAR